ncbi:unnamed protein product [Rotaria magnacalcarata]|uniref:Uncharacterized protein n=1 Tax=Rotaria magnacalcarata TaxID=392030 RepID=A0A819XG01_9BILA|nr:unnamed protein product [Rotaria magnacalcarata]CAF4022941.1 unnamed protein product [Rotaria magnacalcarata]CAF4138943.1 unnamed protein product [Rotaria magnacalcarata]
MMNFFLYPPPIVPWHKFTSLNIAQPFNPTHLHVLFSCMSNIRTLELHYRSQVDIDIYFDVEPLIDIVNDVSLCNMLMSNGLRQLNVFTAWDQSNLIKITY